MSGGGGGGGAGGRPTSRGPPPSAEWSGQLVAGEYPSGTSGGGLGSIPGSATVLQAGQGVHVILPSGGGGSSHATASGDSPYLQRLPPVMRRSVSGTGARPHTQRVFAGGRERDGRPNDPAAGGGFEALAAQSSEL